MVFEYSCKAYYFLYYPNRVLVLHVAQEESCKTKKEVQKPGRPTAHVPRFPYSFLTAAYPIFVYHLSVQQ